MWWSSGKGDYRISLLQVNVLERGKLGRTRKKNSSCFFLHFYQSSPTFHSSQGSFLSHSRRLKPHSSFFRQKHLNLYQQPRDLYPLKMSNMNRRLGTKLIGFLALLSQNPGLPPATRDQATYITASYSEHRNVYRLMAQISALSNGETVINTSHRTRSMAEDRHAPASRFGVCLQALMTDFRITPTVPDFEGHPIELYSILDPVIESWMSGEQEFEFHRALLSMERRANEHLAHLTKKYGYHFIFRIGLQQYYMT